MKRSTFETVLGALVLIVAGIFMFFAYSVTDISGADGYEVRAQFNKIGGLTIGNDVRISGVKVGSVRDVRLNPETFKADVLMSMDPNVALPVDSIAQVATEGLLGGYFMQVIPGVEEDMLASGDVISLTQPPVDLMDLLGRFIFSSADEGGAS